MDLHAAFIFNVVSAGIMFECSHFTTWLVFVLSILHSFSFLKLIFVGVYILYMVLGYRMFLMPMYDV